MQDPEAAVQAQLKELSDKIDAITATAQPGTKCSADMPHPTGLTYFRGKNVYSCQCGQTYRKGGQGDLVEVN